MVKHWTFLVIRTDKRMLLLVIAVLVIAVLVFKDAIWKYFKVYRTYSVIPSTKNKLPVLGSILDLPLAPHGN